MAHTRKRLRVFVVDDEFVIASTLGLILTHKGFDAVSFQAPSEALAAARSQAPDLLISDVVMPQFSGIELAIQIQKQCPNCKVLLFSGQAATAGMLEDARAKGYDFEILSKPVHPTDLLRKVAEATGHLESMSSSADETAAEAAAKHDPLAAPKSPGL
ncbi:MAG: response regulator [Terracidiphilus sp.]|jgi:DNA-binding NtrC family response regulator